MWQTDGRRVRAALVTVALHTEPGRPHPLFAAPAGRRKGMWKKGLFDRAVDTV